MYDEAVWLLGIAVKYNDLLHGKFGGVLYWGNVSFLLINLDGDNSISLHPKKNHNSSQMILVTWISPQNKISLGIKSTDEMWVGDLRNCQ